MKCESQISTYCRKIFRKDKVKYIWHKGKPLKVCDNCYWILKQKPKNPGRGGYNTHKNVSKNS